MLSVNRFAQSQRFVVVYSIRRWALDLERWTFAPQQRMSLRPFPIPSDEVDRLKRVTVPPCNVVHTFDNAKFCVKSEE